MLRMTTKRAIVIVLTMTMLACQSAYFAGLTTQPGEVLFEDDFSARTNGWTRLANEGGVMDYDGGGFRIFVSAPRHDYWSTPGLDFRDVRLEADTLKFAGPDENRIGLICRYRDAQNYYFSVISSDGYYAIGKVKDGQRSLLGQAEMQYSPAIEKGLAINHLRVECVGSTLRFFVNDQPVALAQDADFPDGDVGLLAGTFDEAGVDVVFDNFVVIAP
ncbi:MAG: hypothetical protein GXP40_00215 [Chloroflexi bacterium]|nr:hypothetical protein [Chloroflexota bacterium]